MNKNFPCTCPQLCRSGMKSRGLMLCWILLSLMFLAAGCGGPQVKRLSEERLKALARDARVDVYVGEVKVPHKDVALIESNTSTFVDDGVKLEQIEQLRKSARRLGANSIQNVHILTKHVRGATIDEFVPFAAWQQGQYELYFMRGEAIFVPEAQATSAGVAPSSLDQPKPKEGWAVDQLAAPVPLVDSADSTPTLPAQK